MGVHQSFYFGPYISCIYEPVDQLERIRKCSNDHSPSAYGDFCSVCGGAIQTRMVKTGKMGSRIDWSAIEDQVNDRLYSVSSMCGPFGAPNTHYWLPNIKYGATRSMSLDRYEENAQEVTPELLSSETKLLQDFFSEELYVLRQHYKDVRVVWGILSYCN